MKTEYSWIMAISYLPLLTDPDATSVRAAEARVAIVGAITADVDGTVVALDLLCSASTFGAMVIGVSEMIQKVENDNRAHAERLACAVQEGAWSHTLEQHSIKFHRILRQRSSWRTWLL